MQPLLTLVRCVLPSFDWDGRTRGWRLVAVDATTLLQEIDEKYQGFIGELLERAIERDLPDSDLDEEDEEEEDNDEAAPEAE